MLKKDENLLIWMISGAISVLLFTNGYSIALKLWGVLPFYSWNLAADFLLQGRSDIESLWGFVVGIVADYLFGIINAFLIGLILEWRGTKYYWLKGIGVAFINWIALGILTQILPEFFTYQITPFNYVAFIPGYIGLGALTAYLIVNLPKQYEKGWNRQNP